MMLGLAIAGAIGLVVLAERSAEQLLFAIAALLFTAALMLIFVADLERAVLLSCVLVIAIVGLSIVKFDHSALKLTVSDLPLVFAGTVPFFVSQYPRMMLGVLVGSFVLAFASAAVLLFAAGSPISTELRILVFGVALGCFAAIFAAKGAASWRLTLSQPRCFYSTFMASLIDPASWQQFGRLTLSDIAIEPLPLRAAVPARSTRFPDIIVIQHESVFDPRIFGLPIEPVVEAFLAPADGEHGSLNVDIFGGGSWQSEFSLLTGLSSASFGSSAYQLFRKGAGRFHSSLTHSLASLGYQTTLMSSCRRSFLNYDEFYSSIGMSERIFIDDIPPPFDTRRFEATNSDALFLEAVIDGYASSIADNPAAPRFLYVLTNFNHGPHDRRLIPPGQFETERAFAMAHLPDCRYAEYYARLVETASTWQKLKRKLERTLPERPLLVVHYGDHQPVFTNRFDRQLKLAGDARRAFRTFYAMDGLNIPPEQFRSGRGADLDIAFLGTVALQRAGLPLDPIFSTRASLLDDCGETYFASPSERKRRFHRTLVDMGLIDLVRNVRHAG